MGATGDVAATQQLRTRAEALERQARDLERLTFQLRAYAGQLQPGIRDVQESLTLGVLDGVAGRQVRAQLTDAQTQIQRAIGELQRDSSRAWRRAAHCRSAAEDLRRRASSAS